MFATTAHRCPSCGHEWTATASEERKVTAQWRERQLEQARTLIANGSRVAWAAKAINVPVRTLYHWLNRDGQPVHLLKDDRS